MSKLALFWENSDNTYLLGLLSKKDNIFCFDICRDTLNKAISHGCFGIGNFDLTKSHFESDTLFPFFKERLPSCLALQDKLSNYDELALLQITEARLATDRYFVKAQN